MKRLHVVCAAGFASLLTLIPLQAQDTATLVLRDGQRLTGEVYQMNASGVTLRNSGQDRVYPTDSVAAIEFVPGAPPAETRTKLQAGQPVVVLKSGTVVEGRLVEISKDAPRRFTLDTPVGRHALMANEIAKVYLQDLPMAVSLTPGTIAHVVESGATLGGIAVPANEAWISTSVTVRQGEQLRFSGTGEIMVNSTAKSQIVGAPAATVPSARYPVQGAPAGALIARIGDGQPFTIGGALQPMTMPASGPLFLGINDDRFDDNKGQFMVMIAR